MDNVSYSFIELSSCDNYFFFAVSFYAMDLPIDPTDSLWERLEEDFQFTLGQSRSIPHSPSTSRQIGMYFSSYCINKFLLIFVEIIVICRAKAYKGLQQNVFQWFFSNWLYWFDSYSCATTESKRFNDKERKVRASASNTYYFFYNFT